MTVERSREPDIEECAMKDTTSVAATIRTSELDEAFVEVERIRRESSREIVALHVGEPFFRPPASVALALSDAVQNRSMSYTPVEGLPQLRATLAQKVSAARGGYVDRSHVFVTPGSVQGLAALMQALASPGAEILMPDLYWPNHLQQVLLAGLHPRFYAMHDGIVDVDRVVESASPATRIVLINSPANPSGTVWPSPALRQLVETARARGWHVISDEAYEDFVYEGRHVSAASCEVDRPADERVVTTVHTFSKSYAMTGYRVGYVVAAKAAIARALRVVQEANLIAMSTPVQYAALQALEESEFVRDNRRALLEARDQILPSLVDAGLMTALPAGGWYGILDVASTGMSSEEFARRLLEECDVAVVRGSGFARVPRLDAHGRVIDMAPSPWANSLLRIAFCVDRDVLRRGVDRIVEFAARHHGQGR
jgi:aspartate aminotransferase